MSVKENLQLKILKGDFIKTRVSIKELVQEVRQHSGTQSELNELAVLIRLKFSQLNEQIEELSKLHLEQDNNEEKNAIQKEMDEWKQQVPDDHRVFRNALLAAQLAITQRSKDELFSSSSPSPSSSSSVRHRDKMSQEIMMKTSSRLTDDLLTVTRMIRDNTEKSTKTLDTLVDSSQMVTSTQEELKNMGSVIGQAKKILSKYGRRENTDKLLIF